MTRENLDQFNLERVRLYIDALRSGKYTQTTGKLRGDNCFCALGVAAEASIQNGAPAEWTLDYGVRWELISKSGDPYDFAVTRLIVAVNDWYGGDLDAVSLFENDKQRPECITVANDEQGWSFPQIADRLEALFFDWRIS